MGNKNQTSELERELDETREHLAATIDQLLYRSHPKTVIRREVAAIKGHYVDAETGGPRTTNILKTVGVVGGVVGLFVAIRQLSHR